MKEIILKIIDPIQGNLIHFTIAFTGVLSTFACFVPKDSKLGKILHYALNQIVKLKNKILKK